VPAAADILQLVGFLAQLEDLRELGKALGERIERRLGEIAPVAQQITSAQFLVADIDRAVIEKGAVNLRDFLVAQRLAEVDPADLGAERAGQRFHRNRLVGHRRDPSPIAVYSIPAFAGMIV